MIVKVSSLKQRNPVTGIMTFQQLLTMEVSCSCRPCVL